MTLNPVIQPLMSCSKVQVSGMVCCSDQLRFYVIQSCFHQISKERQFGI